MQTATEIPEETRVAATQEGLFPMARFTLLGTYLKPDGESALIRLANGRIRKVAPGDTVQGGIVTAIEDGQIHLAREGDSRRMSVPGQ